MKRTKRRKRTNKIKKYTEYYLVRTGYEAKPKSLDAFAFKTKPEMRNFIREYRASFPKGYYDYAFVRVPLGQRKLDL